MKILPLVFVCFFSPVLLTAKANNKTITSPRLTPLDTYNKLCLDVISILKEALAEPSDFKAMALLKTRESSLVERQRLIKPAFRKWLRTLPLPKQRNIRQQVQSSALIKFIQSMENDSKSNNRINRNPKLAECIQKFIYISFIDLK